QNAQMMGDFDDVFPQFGRQVANVLFPLEQAEYDPQPVGIGECPKPLSTILKILAALHRWQDALSRSPRRAVSCGARFVAHVDGMVIVPAARLGTIPPKRAASREPD